MNNIIIRLSGSIKKLKCLILVLCVALLIECTHTSFCVYGFEKVNPNELYSISACLMDADSNRVLYEKNGFEERAMASTTKIMTLIIALENVEDNIKVVISKTAANQPKVKLGMYAGDEFYINDLYYSLMLESHNDTAYAIAEAVGGSVEEFAKMMNDKAKEIGALNTYFITPNGLDAKDEVGTHHTTATDLAKIMSYCITKSPLATRFIEITKTKNYSFCNVTGSKSYSVYNHNAFLDMMEGVLTGKTGFTSEAGYCYVCALNRDGRNYVVALLGCGWPNNKSYKWSDTKKLMNYGIDNFKKVNIYSDTILEDIVIKSDYDYIEYPKIKLEVEKDDDGLIELLLSSEDMYEKKIDLSEDINLPIYNDEVLGKVSYLVNGDIIAEYNIYSNTNIKNIDFRLFLKHIIKMYLLD